MSEAPRNDSSTQKASSPVIPVILLLLCLGAAGGGYWYLTHGPAGFAKLPFIGELLSKGQDSADQDSQGASDRPDSGTGTGAAATNWNLQEEANRFPGQQPGLSGQEPTTQTDQLLESGKDAAGGETALKGQETALQGGGENREQLDHSGEDGNPQEPEGQSQPQSEQAAQPQDHTDGEQKTENPGAQDNAPAAIIYGQGKPASPGGNVVRGEVPNASVAVDTKRMYDGSAKSRAEDSIVSAGFVEGLARFLTDNYWPAGTHPMAKRRPFTTADIKWANLKYGVQLEGFSVGGNAPQAGRRKVLQYVLMPSMVKGLYNLYSERFVAALEYEALTRPRTLNGKERTLTGPETAQMFGLYANQARAVSGTMRSYFADERNKELVQSYIKSEEDVHNAYQLYSEVNEGRTQSHTAARDYQGAVIRREQARENVASSLRKGGNTRGLDTDSLLFVAMWLHRRQADDNSALFALADVLEDCAARLEQEQKSYEAMLRPSAVSGENSQKTVPMSSGTSETRSASPAAAE